MVKTRLLIVFVTCLGFWASLAMAFDEAFAPAYDDGIHTELQAASWLGEQDRVRDLLEAGAEVDEVDPENGATPLMFAAAGGHLEVMEMLLGYGADPSARSVHGAPPLSYAIMYEEHDAAALLLAAGSGVNDSWFEGTTPLLAASHRGDVAMMGLFIDAGADLSARYASGVCALSAAASSGNPDAVRLLLELGFDVETVNRRGSSALMFAAINGHPGVIRVLLEAGAAVDAARENGETPLLRAAASGCRECVEILLNSGAAVDARSENGANALMYAAWSGQQGVLDTLTTGGVTLHEADAHGATALMYAATRGHPEVVAKLLELGAEIDRAASNGETALMRAAKADCEPCVVELLHAGADFTIQSESDHTALDIAVANGSDASLRTMIRVGILDGASQERLDQLLLQSVGGGSSLEAISLILELGADPNCRGANERTPLHIAAVKANADAIELLLEAGADVYAKDRRGMVPIFLANMPGRGGKSELSILRLLRAGPDFIDQASLVNFQGWFRNVATQLSVDGFRELVEVSGCLSRLDETLLQRHINLVGATGDIKRLAVIGANLEPEDTASWILGAAVRYAARAVERGYEVDDLDLLPDYSRLAITWPKGRTPLHGAGVTTQGVDFAVALGIDPNAEDDQGNRPLYWFLSARHEGSTIVLRRLLEAGADPNRANRRSVALDHAIHHGRVDTLEILLDAGADPGLCLLENSDQEVTNRLVRAARHEGMLELLVEAGLDPNEGDRTSPALHILVQTTNSVARRVRLTSHPSALQSIRAELDVQLAAIGRLISAGFDIESRDSNGRTPLMLTTDFEVFSMLVDHGADIEVVDAEENGILELATRHRTHYDPRIVVLLCQHKGLWDRAVSRGINPIAGVIAGDDPEALKSLLASVPDIDVADERGQTALFAAVRQYAGVSVSRYHAPDDQFDEARLTRALVILESLLEFGANARVMDNSGRIVLHEPVDIPVVRLLIEHGCDVNARDRAMRTPLHAAAQRRDAISLRALLDFGADPLLADANGRLAIDYLGEPANAASHGGSHDLHEVYRRVYWRLKEASLP
jgi:ankyrin repeat protein